MKNRRISKATWEEIKTAYFSGIGLRELARNMKIPAATILARARREGWTRQAQAAKALASTQEKLPTVANAVAITMKQRGQKHLARMADTVDRIMRTVEQLDAAQLLDLIERVEKLDKIARRTYGLSENGQSSESRPRLALVALGAGLEGARLAAELDIGGVREDYREPPKRAEARVIEPTPNAPADAPPASARPRWRRCEL
jgi:hypothetical protein